MEGIVADDFKRLQEALRAFQDRVAQWNQEWPALLKACEPAAPPIERLLKPSLEALEQEWATVDQAWSAHFQEQGATIQTLERTIRKLQYPPAPGPLRPSAESSRWSRLWNYLNETAIEISPLSKRS